MDADTTISNTLNDPPSPELSPPFGLTQTINVMLNARMKASNRNQHATTSGQFCRALVLTETTQEMRETLADMGRPLWQRYKMENRRHRQQPQEEQAYYHLHAWHNLLLFAEDKLLTSDPQITLSSASYYGVAALLCRIELRPHSWSPVAARFVADHMAVLSYPTGGGSLSSSYASEPILAFGAARVWYDPAPATSSNSSKWRHLFEARLLPELRRMLYEKVLETEGSCIEELVAKIVLLLAMDATGVVATGSECDRKYAGAFYSVATFLKTLSGDCRTVVPKESGPVTGKIDELLKPWQGWQMGFCQFVEILEEPTDDVLWAMLARRAACAMPRKSDGVVELMVPIFKKPDPSTLDDEEEANVSLILIQVIDNRHGDDDGDAAVLLKTRSSVVWEGDLKKQTKSKGVVHVSLSLRHTGSFEQYFRAASCSEAATTTSMVLCILGLDGWHTDHGHVCVVSTEAANQLKELLVEADLDRQDAAVEIRKRNEFTRDARADDLDAAVQQPKKRQEKCVVEWKR